MTSAKVGLPFATANRVQGRERSLHPLLQMWSLGQLGTDRRGGLPCLALVDLLFQRLDRRIDSSQAVFQFIAHPFQKAQLSFLVLTFIRPSGAAVLPSEKREHDGVKSQASPTL